MGKVVIAIAIIGVVGCSKAPDVTVIDLGSADSAIDHSETDFGSADVAVDGGSPTDTGDAGPGADAPPTLPELPPQTWPQSCDLRMPARLFQHAVGNHYFDNAEGGFNLDVEGELIAVVGGQTGLHLFDISSGTPVHRSTTVVEDGREGGAVLAAVHLRGTRAWVGTLFGAWFDVDISDPANPLAATVPSFEDASMHFVGDRLWVAFDDTLEEHDPDSPGTPLWQVDRPGLGFGNWGGVTGDNDTLWLVNSTGGAAELFELDVSQAGQTPVQRLDLPFAVSDAVASGDVLYVQGRSDNIALVDVADSTNVTLRGTAAVPSPWGMYVENDSLFVTSDGDGVYRFDVSNTAAPRLQVVAPLGRRPTAVRARGDEVFVADLYGGLVVGDFTDVGVIPSSSGAQLLPIAGSVRGLEVRWPWMYSWLRRGNESVLGIANIGSSVQAFDGTLELGEHTGLATAAGENVLFALADRLYAVNASSPDDPHVIGTTDVSSAGSLRVAGDLAAIDGVEWFDVSAPEEPTSLGTSTLEAPRWFQMEPERLYGAWSTDLRAYDVTDPLMPELLWQTPLPSGVDNLAIGENHLVAIRDDIWGVVFIDKTSGEILHRHPVGFFVNRVATIGDLTVVTAEPQKMVVIDTSDGYDRVRSAAIELPHDASRLVLSGGRAVMTRTNALFSVQLCP